jgi:hypothetical protein
MDLIQNIKDYILEINLMSYININLHNIHLINNLSQIFKEIQMMLAIRLENYKAKNKFKITLKINIHICSKVHQKEKLIDKVVKEL